MRLWLFLLASLLLVSCGETEKKRRTLGYKGEAKNNPFLAAQRFLTEQGKLVSTEHGLSHFEDDTAMIFLPPSSINTVGRAKRLLEWMESGGHLVVMLEGGEKGGNDFTKDPGEWSMFDFDDEERPGLDYIMEQLEVELDEWKHESADTSVDLDSMDTDEWEEMEEKDRVLLGAEQIEILLENEPLEIYHWSDQGLIYPEVYENEYGSGEIDSSEKHRYLSVTYDLGRVTFLADARPFRNRYIGYADHARFLDELTELSAPGAIIFSSGDGDGLITLLWRHFPLFMVALAVAVAFWLWQHLPRFGPEQDLPGGGMREFSSQVRGVGRFLWHHKRDDTMLGALRASVNRSLSLQPGASQEGVFEQIAEKSALPVESVIEAMTREHIHDPGVMVRVTNHLQIILNTLTKNK